MVGMPSVLNVRASAVLGDAGAARPRAAPSPLNSERTSPLSESLPPTSAPGRCSPLPSNPAQVRRLFGAVALQARPILSPQRSVGLAHVLSFQRITVDPRSTSLVCGDRAGAVEQARGGAAQLFIVFCFLFLCRLASTASLSQTRPAIPLLVGATHWSSSQTKPGLNHAVSPSMAS